MNWQRFRDDKPVANLSILVKKKLDCDSYYAIIDSDNWIEAFFAQRERWRKEIDRDEALKATCDSKERERIMLEAAEGIEKCKAIEDKTVRLFRDTRGIERRLLDLGLWTYISELERIDRDSNENLISELSSIERAIRNHE